MGGPLRVTLEWKGRGWPSKGHIGVEGVWPSKGHIGVEMGVGDPLLCLCVCRNCTRIALWRSGLATQASQSTTRQNWSAAPLQLLPNTH